VALAARDAVLAEPRPVGLEAGEGIRDGAWGSRAGAGDVDGVEADLTFARAR